VAKGIKLMSFITAHDLFVFLLGFGLAVWLYPRASKFSQAWKKQLEEEDSKSWGR
jgi:hypothetical protein